MSTHADWDGWLEFCLTGTVEQARDTIRRCERLVALRKHFVDRVEGRGSFRLVKIIESLFRSPVIRVVDVQRSLAVTHPTARADLNRLVEAGILQELPKESLKTFAAPEIFNVAFGDD